MAWCTSPPARAAAASPHAMQSRAIAARTRSTRSPGSRSGTGPTASSAPPSPTASTSTSPAARASSASRRTGALRRSQNERNDQPGQRPDQVRVLENARKVEDHADRSREPSSPNPEAAGAPLRPREPRSERKPGEQRHHQKGHGNEGELLQQHGAAE